MIVTPSLSLFQISIWITKVFVSSKGILGLHCTWETWNLCDINIIPRNNLSRVYRERERKEREWLCSSRTHLSRKSCDPPLRFLQDELFYPVIYLKYALKSYQGHDRALSASKNSFERLPISGTKFKILFDQLSRINDSLEKWSSERERTRKKKKIRKKEKKEFKFNELFVNEVARKQRVMRFEGFSRRKEARFSYLE